MVTRRSPVRKKTAYLALGGPPARRGSGWLVLVLGALVVVNLYVFVWDKNTSVPAVQKLADSKTPAASIPSAPLAHAAPAPLPVAHVDAPVAPPGVIDGKVSKSDTLGRLLKKSGLTATETDEVIRALSGVLDFKTIRAGQTYRIERGPDGRVCVFELVVNKLHKVRAERGDKGELVGRSLSTQARVDDEPIGGVRSCTWTQRAT
jgi:hypothetical protein